MAVPKGPIFPIRSNANRAKIGIQNKNGALTNENKYKVVQNTSMNHESSFQNNTLNDQTMNTHMNEIKSKNTFQ